MIKLIDPISGKPLPKINKIDGIFDLFFDDNELTERMANFYNDIKFPSYDDIDDFSTLLAKNSSNFFLSHLDKHIPYKSSILEAGCGTGQLGISLSRFSRHIYSIDISSGSLQEAHNFLIQNKIENVNLYRMNIFKLCFPDDSFDYVISNGVLHHTHNPKKAFRNLVKVLKNNGYIIIGLYHKYGRLFTNFKQFLFNRIPSSKLHKIDTRLNEKISNNQKKAWFMDQFFNPHEKSYTFNEVKNWFDEYNVEYINSIPFHSNQENNIFKKNNSEKVSFVKEFSLAFSPSQIYEGGFFVMIGKKNN